MIFVYEISFLTTDIYKFYIFVLFCFDLFSTYKLCLSNNHKVKIIKNTKLLPPLNCGDHVVILNQTGNFPSKWGKSGVVVEVKDCHQFVVKVDGSGRLTVRNRKFLRRFAPPVFQIPHLRKANIPL